MRGAVNGMSASVKQKSMHKHTPSKGGWGGWEGVKPFFSLISKASPELPMDLCRQLDNDLGLCHRLPVTITSWPSHHDGQLVQRGIK
jgi:hypothetical protein